MPSNPFRRRASRPRRPGRGRSGFTLIEVLVAMVILAVGLLALESMAIGAYRMVVRADRQAVFTSLASEELERALRTFHAAQPLASGTRVVDGATVATVVTPQPAPIGNNAVLVDVTVTPPEGGLNLREVRMVGRAYR